MLSFSGLIGLQGDMELLRKRHSEAELKTARDMHQLNKEIGELESLIESKIYREVGSFSCGRSQPADEGNRMS